MRDLIIRAEAVEPGSVQNFKDSVLYDIPEPAAAVINATCSENGISSEASETLKENLSGKDTNEIISAMEGLQVQLQFSEEGVSPDDVVNAFNQGLEQEKPKGPS